MTLRCPSWSTRSWLVKGLVLPRAAGKKPPLPDARLLGYSLALTLEEKLERVQLLVLQERELDWAGNPAPQSMAESRTACEGIVFS